MGFVFICLFNNLLIILWTLTITYVLTQDPVAILPQGRIVGIKVYTEDAPTPVEIFFGVPYATPPIGRYRFSAPERHNGWRRTFFAHRIPPHCPQFGDNESDKFSEDCLFLNIWTPRRADGKSLPVVIILYSESWIQGGISLPCQELAAEGIVVVTVAYRLHLLSFFTLGSISARGNLALLDQYLALLWIHDNIAAFGGDPTAITLIGHSAGAESVLHHIASPRTVGLFQRAIIMSQMNPWKVVDDRHNVNSNDAIRISREIARRLGCDNNSDQEILNCMRTLSITDIVALYSNSSWSKYMQPVSDQFLPESEQYLPTSLPAALSGVNQPIMELDLLLGATDLEFINYNDENYRQLLRLNSSQISEYIDNNAIPDILRKFSLHQTDAIALLTHAVRWEYWEKYTKNDNVMDSLLALEKLARIESTAKWDAGNALVAARLARRVSRLYVYRYSQSSSIDLQGQQLNFTGAIHGTDLIALLGDALMLQIGRRRSTPNEKLVSSIFRQYIGNFIKYGSPGIENEWKRYKVGDAQIYDIQHSENNNDKFRAKKDGTFWLQYLPQLYNLRSISEHTEQLTSEKGETRLRGGVFAMCGVSVVLLILLCACVILLRKERTQRSSIADESHR
ncbi:carboxylesterase 4A [Galleria mellonella]|uniref:Carboxylic ester hydrolase n=1 Tax=Galleria mellonella TaxID=7137 RepID=A0ABM3N601_GALME|nr:carboxylesterase 4A [Galleria mellonella]